MLENSRKSTPSHAISGFVKTLAFRLPNAGFPAFPYDGLPKRYYPASCGGLAISEVLRTTEQSRGPPGPEKVAFGSPQDPTKVRPPSSPEKPTCPELERTSLQARQSSTISARNPRSHLVKVSGWGLRDCIEDLTSEVTISPHSRSVFSLLSITQWPRQQILSPIGLLPGGPHGCILNTRNPYYFLVRTVGLRADWWTSARLTLGKNPLYCAR